VLFTFSIALDDTYASVPSTTLLCPVGVCPLHAVVEQIIIVLALEVAVFCDAVPLKHGNKRSSYPIFMAMLFSVERDRS